ncbi:MAG: hypothetical protein WCI77_02020 [Candidatus Omnitrophota bacterium]
MKKLIPLLIVIIAIISPIKTFPDAGDPLPIPNISATEAINLANQYFKVLLSDSKIKAEDCILLSAEWTNHYRDSYYEEWSWIVRFVHPIHNDVSWTFKVTNTRKVITIEHTV